VADNGGVVARCPCKCTAVTNLLLNVADDGSLGALSDGDDVADCERGFLSAVDEGAGVETLSGDESLFAELVAVGVTEDYSGQRCTTELGF
jgi:hypothetical protein